jgi:hypothetical protein
MRLRFTIRDLLWLTAVLALAVCWWTDIKTRRFRFGVEQGYENRIEKKYENELNDLRNQVEWLRGSMDAAKRQLAHQSK